MSAPAILSDLAAAGVTMFLEAGRLRYRSQSPTAFTADLRAAVTANRASIVAFLERLHPEVQGVTAAEDDPRTALNRLADRQPAGLVGRYGARVAGVLLDLVQRWEVARGRAPAKAAKLEAEFRQAAAEAEAMPAPEPRRSNPKPQAVQEQPRAVVHVEPEAEWPVDLGDLVAALDYITADALPASIVLGPGVRANNPALFLERLREDVARGPNTIRARRGLLARDIEAVLAAVWETPIARTGIEGGNAASGADMQGGPPIEAHPETRIVSSAERARGGVHSEEAPDAGRAAC